MAQGLGVESEARGGKQTGLFWKIWGELKAGILAWCPAPARGNLLKGQNVAWTLWVTEAGGLGKVTLGSQ